jgi:hypothetical protein
MEGRKTDLGYLALAESSVRLAAAITYRTEKLFERRSKSMWLGLAAITLASAIGFSVLAVTIQEV